MDYEALRGQLRGELLTPDRPTYEAARAIWNAMIDRRPAAIARCRNAADVMACVNAARENEVVVAIRAGGHNVAGYAACDGGLVIDLSSMNAVRIDPRLDRAYVEGGAAWADVDAATTPFGRATPGGLISATGVAGLTLSGGIGWLRGTHGLCVDNLLAADVVTADGRLIRASESENADLLWALKGGGGNFGVVVAFEFRLHPIAAELMFCAPAYAEERALEVLPKWRDYMASAPDEVSGLAEFSTIPRDPAYPPHAWGRRVVSLATVYDGPAAEGERITAPLREFGEPLVDFSDRMPYRVLQALYDGLFPKGRDRCYWKSTYLKATRRRRNRRDCRPTRETSFRNDIHFRVEVWWRGTASGLGGNGFRRPLDALHAEYRRNLVEIGRGFREYRLGSRLLADHAASFDGPPLPQLPRPRRRRKSGSRRVRGTSLRSAASHQAGV